MNFVKFLRTSLVAASRYGKVKWSRFFFLCWDCHNRENMKVSLISTIKLLKNRQSRDTAEAYLGNSQMSLMKHFCENVRSTHRRCSRKKGFLKNFANLTGRHLCWSHFLIKLQALRLQHRCFPVIFGKLLRIPILKDIYQWLLLENSSRFIFTKNVPSWMFDSVLNTPNLRCRYSKKIRKTPKKYWWGSPF